MPLLQSTILARGIPIFQLMKTRLQCILWMSTKHDDNNEIDAMHTYSQYISLLRAEHQASSSTIMVYWIL